MGCLCRSKAIAPVTMGAAMDVPLNEMCCRSALIRSGNSAARATLCPLMPAPKVLTILRPGATRSGLAKPSSVRPRLLIGHRLSSVGDGV